MICFSLKSANSALQAEQKKSVIQSLPEPFWAIVNWTVSALIKGAK